MKLVFILAAIAIFGLLVTVHELGHFLQQSCAVCGSMSFPSAWAR